MSCNANLTYRIGEGGPRSDCRHTDGYFYCVEPPGHEGKHKAAVTFEASTERDPFLYEHVVIVEWD